MNPARNLKSIVTHWTTTPDGTGGYTFGTPDSTFKGHWTERNELFRDVEGNEVVANAIVFLDKDITVGDYIFLGTSTVADPTTVVGAHQVRQFNKRPTLRVTAYERKAFL